MGEVGAAASSARTRAAFDMRMRPRRWVEGVTRTSTPPTLGLRGCRVAAARRDLSGVPVEYAQVRLGQVHEAFSSCALGSWF